MIFQPKIRSTFIQKQPNSLRLKFLYTYDILVISDDFSLSKILSKSRFWGLTNRGLAFNFVI